MPLAVTCPCCDRSPDTYIPRPITAVPLDRPGVNLLNTTQFQPAACSSNPRSSRVSPNDFNRCVGKKRGTHCCYQAGYHQHQTISHPCAAVLLLLYIFSHVIFPTGRGLTCLLASFLRYSFPFPLWEKLRRLKIFRTIDHPCLPPPRYDLFTSGR